MGFEKAWKRLKVRHWVAVDRSCQGWLMRSPATSTESTWRWVRRSHFLYCCVHNAIHVVELYGGSGWFLDIVGCRGWWPTGDGGAVRSQLGIAGATLPQHISTSCLLYRNVSQHLGYFTSTLPTQHRNAQFEEPTLFTYLLVKSSISTINTFDVFTSKSKMGSAALHISYILLIL